MQKVLGFGGFFFRARDPIGLAQWYEDHLGINIAPTNMEMQPWESESGVTVFAPFDAETDHFPAVAALPQLKASLTQYGLDAATNR